MHSEGRKHYNVHFEG